MIDNKLAQYFDRAMQSPGCEMLEQIIQLIYTNVLRPGDVAIDGGSADGRHTRPMATAVGETGLVIAVEPLYDVYSKRDWAVNYTGNNIAVVEAALSDHLGVADFNAVDGVPGYSSLKRGYWKQEHVVNVRKVELTTIDAIVAGKAVASPHFVKLDLEGGEFHALLGAMNCMARKETVFVFEHARGLSPANFGYNPDNLFELSRRFDYIVYDVLGRSYNGTGEFDNHTPHYLAFVPAGTPEDAFFKQEFSGLIDKFFANIQ
ncbi:FkbM family methyltransferase [Solidesulfovibrio sp.]